MISKVLWSKWENVFSSSENTGKFVIQWITLEDDQGGMKTAFTGPIVLYHDLDQVLDHASVIARQSFRQEKLDVTLVEAEDVVQVNGVNPFSGAAE